MICFFIFLSILNLYLWLPLQKIFYYFIAKTWRKKQTIPVLVEQKKNVIVQNAIAHVDVAKEKNAHAKTATVVTIAKQHNKKKANNNTLRDTIINFL